MGDGSGMQPRHSNCGKQQFNNKQPSGSAENVDKITQLSVTEVKIITRDDDDFISQENLSQEPLPNKQHTMNLQSEAAFGFNEKNVRQRRRGKLVRQHREEEQYQPPTNVVFTLADLQNEMKK